MFSLRDFVHLKGEEKDFPYIGAIQEFYRCHDKHMVRVRWMFRPRDTHLDFLDSKLSDFGRNEIFYSREEDENDVRSIIEKVFVYPEGSDITHESKKGRVVYSCCLEYIPAKRIFRPLMNTSILSRGAGTKRGNGGKDMMATNGAVCPYCNRTFQTTQGCGMHKKTCPLKQASLSKRETSAPGDEVPSTILSSSDESTSGSSESSSDSESDEPGIREGPMYQAVIPECFEGNTSRRRTPRKVYEDDPLLLWGCDQIYSSFDVDSFPRTFDIGQRIEVTLPNEKKEHFPAIVTMFDQEQCTVDVVLQDGTVRKHVSCTTVSPSVEATAPLHLLHGLTEAEMKQKGSELIPQMWTSADHAKFFRLFSVYGKKFSTIANKFPNKTLKNIYAFFNYIQSRLNITEMTPRKPSRFSECEVCKRKSAAVEMKSCDQCKTVFCSSCHQLTGGRHGRNSRWLCNLCANPSRIQELKSKNLILKKRAIMNLLYSDGSWACAFCTVLNKPNTFKCRVCTANSPYHGVQTLSKKRKRAKEAPESNGSPAAAEACTTENPLVPHPAVLQNHIATANVMAFLSDLHVMTASLAVNKLKKKNIYMQFLEEIGELSTWLEWSVDEQSHQDQFKSRSMVLDRIFSLFSDCVHTHAFSSHQKRLLSRLTSSLKDKLLEFLPKQFALSYRNRKANML